MRQSTHSVLKTAGRAGSGLTYQCPDHTAWSPQVASFAAFEGCQQAPRATAGEARDPSPTPGLDTPSAGALCAGGRVSAA